MRWDNGAVSGTRCRWRTSRGALALAVLVTASPSLSGQAMPERGEAEVAGRRTALRVASHRSFGVVNANELASAVFDDEAVSGSFLRARLGARELVLEAGSPFFVYGDRSFQLANEPYLWGGSFWVPVEFVTAWMPAYVEGAAPPAAVMADARARRVDPAQPWRVVIDAGHGGRDPGTIGNGTREKDVVLAIARALRDELEEEEMIRPTLTRDSDVYVPHDERSAFAVEQGGDLFVSIHANSVPSASSARGFETYFLGPARSEEAREVALRENRTPDVGDAPAGSVDDRLFILTGLDRTENIAESRRFAGFVQNALREARGRGIPDRGVKQGPWWVLLGALARMPSVIIEVGFVSNRDEAAYLSSGSGQREVARAIARAVTTYRDDVIRRFAGAEGDGN
ncbi:MAG: N-acetylmuramoyl-L-alanine amidase [Gemmatimonadota bacterium]|nr:N-acetylmuramoyl-L-alanine amidase [Gemmatimonadota bacterium]